MQQRKSTAKQEQDPNIPTDRQDLSNRLAPSAEDGLGPDSIELDARRHRPSASPRQRYGQSRRSDLLTSGAETAESGTRNCRTSRKADSARRRNLSGEYRRPSRSASNSPHPITLVERREAMTSGIRIAELAGLLGTGRTTIYDWVAAGTIPAYRHRGVIFFDPVVIAGWLRRQATVVPARAA